MDSVTFSGWHIFFGERHVKGDNNLRLCNQVYVFSPLSLLNIVDSYFVRVMIFVLAPAVYIAFNSKPNQKVNLRL